jgi:hypothetical protein
MFTELSDNAVENKQVKKLTTISDIPVDSKKVAMIKQKIASRDMDIIGSEQEKLTSAERILNKLLEIDNKLPR